MPQPADILAAISGTENPQILLGLDEQVPPRTFVLHRLKVYQHQFGRAATLWNNR